MSMSNLQVNESGRFGTIYSLDAGVVAVLDGVDLDSGTTAEIGYATGPGKWVIGYRCDFRRTGEDVASQVNLRVEFFIVKIMAQS